MNVMVMSGTIDARKIIKELSLLDVNILATATTRHGAELAQSSGADKVLEGYFDSEELAIILKDNIIEILIDATHPFAQNATRNAIKAADAKKIRYIRFERPPLKISENILIHQVHSFEEAVEEILKLTKKDDMILHLAGVMTLHHLTEKIDPEKITARILPSQYSLEKCFELGLPAENIIAMQGIFSKDFNQALMKEYNISLMVTKESGESGGTSSKIEAALELDIPVVMIMRPEVREIKDKKVYSNLDDLCGELIELNNNKKLNTNKS